jgi:hypothetical protein
MELGFIDIPPDFSFRVGNNGGPHSAVLRNVYPEPLSAAVAYFDTLDFVDCGCIGVVGVCGSGDLVLTAAKIDTCVAATTTASMYGIGSAGRKGSSRRTPGGIDGPGRFRGWSHHGGGGMGGPAQVAGLDNRVISGKVLAEDLEMAKV